MNQKATETKNQLVQTFIDKLYKDHFKEITIAEIAAEAGYSRNTFYRYFKDKYELLNYFFNQLLESYFSELRMQTPRNLEELLTTYFSFWQRREEVLQMLKEQQLLTHTLELYNQKILDVLVSLDLPWHRSHPNMRLVLLIMTGGCWNVLHYYLKNQLSFIPSQLAHDICQQILPFEDFL